MESFEKLQNKMKELESETEHKGYYYKVSDALTIMICGMLCNLQNISDIHEWAKAEPVHDFLFKEFRIYSNFPHQIFSPNPPKRQIIVKNMA